LIPVLVFLPHNAMV